MSQYIHDRWGPEQGFPRGPVSAITQTADGFLWIGTQAGLVRFDGWNFRLVTDPSGSINTTNILGLVPDAAGNLWVQLVGPMVVRYRNGAFERPPSGVSYSNITAVSRTTQGELLASATEQGTLVFRANRFEMVADAATLPRSPVVAVTQTGAGDTWIGTRDAGLFRLRQGKFHPVSEGLPDPKINCLLPDGRQALWAGTDNGLAHWDGAALTSIDIRGPSRRLQILALAKDRDGNLWVGTDSRGLIRVNSQGVSFLSEDGPQPEEAVSAVFEDREGSLWIGTSTGLERLRDSLFVTYSPSEGLPSDGDVPLFVDSSNRTWFAPVAGGLQWLKDREHGIIEQAGLNRDVIYSIAGRDQDLWLGRQRGGLTRLHSNSTGFQAQTWTQADGLAQDSVYAVYASLDGTIWAGTLSGGVSQFRKGRFTTYTRASGLASNAVTSILEGSDGTMWFGTPNGLSALANGSWKTYTAGDGLPSRDVNCLLEGSDGALWVGTATGLALGGRQGFRSVAPSASLLKKRILGLAQDRKGSLWIATSSHVLRVKGDALRRDKITDADVDLYGLADGLRGTEGVRRHRSVVTDPLGRIWMSLNRGISVVDPARLATRPPAAIPQIQTISADATTFDAGAPVRVPARPRRIVVGYSGLSLSLPERVRFRYWLEGDDNGWSAPTTEREAAYTNLDPGTYRFHVMATNAAGVWGTDVAALSFEIEPAIWQTWWLRLGGILALSLMVASILRLRTQQWTRELNMRFEERLAERTRIAQELHDTLLQGFLSASMQLQVAAERLPVDSPATPRIGRVLQLMDQVIDESRSAVRGLSSSQVYDLDLEQGFSRIPEEIGIGSDTGFRVIIEGQPRPLHPVLRDEVYRIGREALVNAFRHSEARDIEIELEYTSQQFRLLVRDNGCGIDPETLRSGREGHWGLPGMRERAERVGARLQLWSRAGAGTEIVLTVPRQIAFQDQSAHRRNWLPGMFSRRVRGEFPGQSGENRK